MKFAASLLVAVAAGQVEYAHHVDYHVAPHTHGDVIADHHYTVGKDYESDILVGRDPHDTYLRDFVSHAYEGGKLMDEHYGDRELIGSHVH